MKVPIETRVTLTSLAECLLFFQAQAIPINTKSHAVCACVDMLASLLKNGGHTVMVEDDDKALTVINHILGDKPTVNIDQMLLSTGLSDLVVKIANKKGEL